MKSRAFAAAIVLLGISVLIPLAHADPTVEPKNSKGASYKGENGPDLSQNAWQSWQAPVATVDPGQLIPDSTNLAKGEPAPVNTTKSDSLANTFKGGTPIQIEEAKPIEKIEANTDSAPVLGDAAPKPRSDSKRIMTIAILGVGVLAYSKFRRNARSHPPKPNFL